jgi:hypothetical protein
MRCCTAAACKQRCACRQVHAYLDCCPVEPSLASAMLHVLRCAVLNDYAAAQPLTITVRLLSLKDPRKQNAAGCSAELAPVKLLTVTAPPRFAKWVWSMSVEDLLKQKPGCTRTTCYVHISTSVTGTQLESGLETVAASDLTAPNVMATVRILAPSASHVETRTSAAATQYAEHRSPASWWPKEGASPSPQSPELSKATPPSSSSAAAASATGSAAPQQGDAQLSVPDVQLLLAAPRDIDFVDPKVKSSRPTVSGQWA